MSPSKDDIEEALLPSLTREHLEIDKKILAAALRASEARAELLEEQYDNLIINVKIAYGGDDVDACLFQTFERHVREREALR